MCGVIPRAVVDEETSRTLANFGGQAAGFARRWTTRRQRLNPHRRPVFNRADDWRFVHAVNVCDRGEALLAAHAVDKTLLTSAQDGVRKNGKVAEHPQQVHPLYE